LRGELLHGGTVLAGDGGDRLVDFLVAHADAGIPGTRHLELEQHEALGDLALEHRGGRKLVLATGVLEADVVDRTLELAAQDHVLVHDRGDAVDRLHLLCMRWPRQQCPEDEAGEQFLHGIESKEGSKSSLSSDEGGTRYRSSRS